MTTHFASRSSWPVALAGASVGVLIVLSVAGADSPSPSSCSRNPAPGLFQRLELWHTTSPVEVHSSIGTSCC